MLTNEELKDYKELNHLKNILKTITNIRNIITLNDLEIPYIKEMVISLNNYKTYLTNTIIKKSKKSSLRNKSLTIDDLIKLSLLD